MESLLVGSTGIRSSRIVQGCMRMTGDGSAAAWEHGKRAVRAALEAGITHFDHADIYGEGKCEELFGEVLRESASIRGGITITSKCAIRRREKPKPGDPARYDFSRDWIVSSVEGSLKRLGIETLDILLLHRPDHLFRGEEVAQAFRDLQAAGKVRHFGVSNFTPSQLSLLRRFCPMPLAMNQVEINIHRIAALQDGTLDQCQELGITPEAWCPLGGVAYTAWDNTLTKKDEERIAAELAFQSKRYGAEPWVIVLAWLLKLPSGVLPIIGTTTPDRIRESRRALELPYTREDWYRLLEARTGIPSD
jgi:predicted oxidoreductase